MTTNGTVGVYRTIPTCILWPDALVRLLDWHAILMRMQSGEKQGAPLESHEPVEIDELSMQCQFDDQFEQLQRAQCLFTVALADHRPVTGADDYEVKPKTAATASPKLASVSGIP